VYISFAPKEERETVLALLARSADPHDALARDPAQVSRLLLSTRRRGYALRQGGPIWPHTGALAMPLRARGRLLGAINTIWMARVISAEEGLKRCLEPLREARDLIERRLAERKGRIGQ
jgi:IclR family mhp operon transcriptional activator